MPYESPGGASPGLIIVGAPRAVWLPLRAWLPLGRASLRCKSSGCFRAPTGILEFRAGVCNFDVRLKLPSRTRLRRRFYRREIPPLRAATTLPLPLLRISRTFVFSLSLSVSDFASIERGNRKLSPIHTKFRFRTATFYPNPQIPR